MQRFFLIISLMNVVALSTMREPMIAMLRCLKQYNNVGASGKTISCAERLQNIFEEADTRYEFHVLAQGYLEDTSKGKRNFRNISIFQAFSSHDLGRTRDVFRDKLNALTEIWIKVHQNQKSIDFHAFYTYLTTELFQEHNLPFEISHPRVSETGLQPVFYFSKQIRSIFDDVSAPERIAFENKRRELLMRIEEAGMQNGIQPAHKELLQLIQRHNSEEAYDARVCATAERIADYPSILITAGVRIDEEQKRLMN